MLTCIQQCNYFSHQVNLIMRIVALHHFCTYMSSHLRVLRLLDFLYHVRGSRLRLLEILNERKVFKDVALGWQIDLSVVTVVEQGMEWEAMASFLKVMSGNLPVPDHNRYQQWGARSSTRRPRAWLIKGP